MKERFKKIENYHIDVPEEGKKYICPKEEGEFVSKSVGLR